MTALFHSPGGGTGQRVQAGQVLDLTAPTLADGVPVFRHTLYLRVALDDDCDRVSLGTASALGLRFEPCTVEVTRGDDAWVQTWASGLGIVGGGGAGTTRVELTYPAPVVRVDSDLYGQAALHRVDGDAVSEDPTVSGATGAALPEPFVAAVFQARLSGEKPGVRAYARNREITLHQTGHRSLSAAAVGMQEMQVLDADLREVDHLVELRGGLTALRVAGAPASPRLTLRSADGAEVLWQWIEPGPHDAAVDFAPADLTADWQAALERALTLASDPGPRPSTLVLTLEVASDAPCRAHVQQAQVELLLERPLTDQAAALRFDGVAAQTHAVSLTTPAHGQWLKVQARVAGPNAPGGTGAGSPPPASGLYLEAGASARANVTLPAPVRSTGLGIGWHALDAATTLEVSLYQPPQAPRALAGAVVEGTLDAGTLYARWPALDLQSGPCQVRVAVRAGSGVWAGTPDPQAVTEVDAGTGAVRRTALAPTLGWLSPGSDDAAAAVSIALDGTPIPAVPPPADGPAPPPGALTLRLTPLPSALDGGGACTLTASTACPLTLTVDAVRVAYRPA